MDSFMIYTEPFVLTGGGPGNATTFLSIHLAKIAIGQFDLGPAAAFSLIYFLIVLLFSYIFYQVLTGGGPGNATTFLSIHLAKIAIGQFDLGPAAAFSIIYFLIVLLFSYIFYQVLTRVGQGDKA
jgi:ABC-type sugar transport system permease subunit